MSTVTCLSARALRSSCNSSLASFFAYDGEPKLSVFRSDFLQFPRPYAQACLSLCPRPPRLVNSFSDFSVLGSEEQVTAALVNTREQEWFGEARKPEDELAE